MRPTPNMLGATTVAASLAHVAVAATFTEYTDKNAWQEATGQWTTIGFGDQPSGMVVTTQYSSLGVIFSEGDDSIDTTDSFLEDGYGIQGSFGFNPDDSITI